MPELDRTLAPILNDIQEVLLPEPFSTLVSPGVNFHYIEAGVQPVVRLEIVFSTNFKFEKSAGISHFVLKMLTEGTKRFNSKEIKDHFAFFGSYIETHHGVDRSSLVIHSLGKYLKELLPLIFEILMEPIFDENELETAQKNTIQNLKLNAEKTSILAQMAFKSSMYGELHPYGYSLKSEDVLKVNSQLLKQFYSEAILLHPIDIIVSGKLNSNELDLIINSFKHWKVGGTSVPNLEPEAKSPLKVIVPKKDSLQASIRMGCKTIGKENTNFFNAMIINKVLGGYFGSRLMKNIREDKGYTYGISSTLVNFDQANHWIIGADVKNDVAKRAVEEIYKEIKILTSEPIPLNELNTVKQYILGTFISSSNTPFQLADKFKNVYFGGRNYDYYKSYLFAIKSADSYKLMETASELLNEKSFFEVLSGDINE